MANIGTLLKVKENQYFQLKSISGSVHPKGEYIVIDGVLYQNGERKAVKISNAIIENPYDFIIFPSLNIQR